MKLTNEMSSREMTEGNLWKNIILFSLPLMLSQVLQVLFNMADIAVVGRFSGAAALGSVGSTAILVTLFTGFLIGLGSGVNVRVAQHIGAQNEKAVFETVNTSFFISVGMGVLVCALCFAFAGGMLSILNTKEDLIGGAVLYFRIYSFGMPALALFNFGNAVLSASGDTKSPLMFLLGAGILNVVLNLFFVIVLKMSVEGVALASVISQYVSALLAVIKLVKISGAHRLSPKTATFSVQRAKEVLTLGISAGLQSAIFAIANLFIQAGVNSFDSVMVEGNSAASNADALIYNVMAAVYTACSTFIGQNYGAGKHRRATDTYFISMIYSFAAGAVLGVAAVVFGRQFLALFTTDTLVIEAGMEKLKIMGFSYAFSAFMDCTIAASRGIGKSFVPTVIVVMGSCVFRVIWVYTVFAYFHTIPSLYLLYIFSWVITAIAEIAYFAHAYKKLKRA